MTMLASRISVGWGIYCCTIGSTKLWFPSRKSVASHRGGLSLVLDGHCRLGRSRGLNCLYFLHGSRNLGTILSALSWKLCQCGADEHRHFAGKGGLGRWLGELKTPLTYREEEIKQGCFPNASKALRLMVGRAWWD
jgi:hypothetical protein